jgi:carbonic anhydrase
MLLRVSGDATSPLHMLSNRKRTLSAAAHLQQLHFHTPSEHVVAGVVYPMEMHMVLVVPRTPAISSCPPEGCRMVASVLWELGGDGEDHPQLQKLWQVLPLLEQVRA